MSKESKDAGLHRRYHGAAQVDKAKKEQPLRQGTFIPEQKDYARLLPRLRGAPRR